MLRSSANERKAIIQPSKLPPPPLFPVAGTAAVTVKDAEALAEPTVPVQVNV